MKIIVTGSRDWEDRNYVWHSLDTFYGVSALRREDFELVHGHCPTGVDLFSDEWANAMAWEGGDITVHRYIAHWSEHGRAAGPIRNQQMVDENLYADHVLAFPLGESRGTRGCMTYADGKGLNVINLGER